MLAAIEGPINAKAEQIRRKFQELLDKTNKEDPQPKNVKALSDLLVGNKSFELWRGIASAGYLAELTVIENARATTAVKECWKHRLQVLKKELGAEGAPLFRAALDSAHCIVLAEAESCRVGLFEHNETVNYSNLRLVLGKKTDGCSGAFHPCLRNFGES